MKRVQVYHAIRNKSIKKTGSSSSLGLTTKLELEPYLLLD